MLEQTQVDPLTGCFVRGALSPFLERLIIESKAKAKKFTIALVDLDHFKKFNDRYGHIFGDEILKYFTSTLRLTFSELQSNFFRYGGDEFIGIFMDKEPREILRMMRHCNHNLFHRPLLFKNKFYRITLSCGIVGFPLDGATIEGLINRADEAMYLSKRYGRNRVTLASGIKQLKLLRTLIVIGSIIVIICSIFIAYITIIQPNVDQIKGFEIIRTPQKLDTIILKSGIEFEGRIMAENEAEVTLKLYLDKGEGLMTLNKPEIAQIKYGSGKPAPAKEEHKTPTKK